MTGAEIAERLHARRNGSGGWVGRCPAHQDNKPSLSIHERDAKILLHCFANCTTAAICAALGIGLHDLFVDGNGQNGGGSQIIATYDYQDKAGQLRYQRVRYQPKDFRYRRPTANGDWLWDMKDTPRLLYRLPALATARNVVIVEGEKDVHSAEALGLVATTSGNAGSWLTAFDEELRGKRIAIVADGDTPGRRHAQDIAASLFGKVQSLKIVETPTGKDLSEWVVEHGGTRLALLELIRSAPEWKPTAPSARGTIGSVTRCFTDIAPEPLRWLWPGRIPLGKLMLEIGDPGLGKSIHTLDMAARISRGLEFPDGAVCIRGGVLLLSAEDDAADTIRPRLDAAGADLSRIHILEAVRVALADSAIGERGFNLEADIGALDDALGKIPDARLVVIDPLSAYLGGADSHINAEVRGLLAPLAALASRRSVTVCGIAHLRKSAGAAVHRAIGSIAFAAAARSVWAVAQDPGDPERRLFLPVKQNLAANVGGLAFRIETQDGVPRITWESGSVLMDANDVLGSFDGGESQGARREAESWLTDLLTNGPMPVKKIQSESKTVGLPWITVRRAKDSLGVTAAKEGFSGGWSWRLPDAEGAQEPPKALTFESRASSVSLSAFGPEGEDPPEDAQVSALGAEGEAKDEPPPESEGEPPDAEPPEEQFLEGKI